MGAGAIPACRLFFKIRPSLLSGEHMWPSDSQPFMERMLGVDGT